LRVDLLVNIGRRGYIAYIFFSINEGSFFLPLFAKIALGVVLGLRLDDPKEKLSLLSRGAEYDVLSPQGSFKKPTYPGICRVFARDGKCLSVLKTLFTNYCENHCAYCVNRAQNDMPRVTFGPEEFAKLAYDLYRKGAIDGIFLSSGVLKDPDHTMELMIRAVKILRNNYGFKGYLHLKVLPGASEDLMREAVTLADRVSLNIEFTEETSFKLFTPEKRIDGLLADTIRLSRIVREARERGFKGKVGQSTQIIVGATGESDLSVLKTSLWLYRELEVSRVYYSAYVKVNADAPSPLGPFSPSLRERRLYQADFLIKLYGFALEEILPQGKSFLDRDIDPKLSWALRNLHLFPLEVTKASYEELLRVPGIGPKSAKRIVEERGKVPLSLEVLKGFGVVVERARSFITIKGRYFGDRAFPSIKWERLEAGIQLSLL